MNGTSQPKHFLISVANAHEIIGDRFEDTPSIFPDHRPSTKVLEHTEVIRHVSIIPEGYLTGEQFHDHQPVVIGNEDIQWAGTDLNRAR